MTTVVETESNSARDAQGRGDRLYPPRTGRCYWVLTRLRREIESIAAEFFSTADVGILVDYGCGNMPYRPLFKQFIHEYLGCDLPGNDLADRILDGPIDLPFESNTVDALLSSQVLEHVLNPDAYLREANRVLRHGGLLVLSTHGVWRFHPDPGDFWRWTSTGLRKQIDQAGFEILRFKGVMGPEATALQLYQDSVLPRIPRWYRKAYTWRMQWRIRKADRRCADAVRDSDACVYVLVARKK